jgi:RNA polymerase subunit RPABC4/transcription elongation factor Spt4
MFKKKVCPNCGESIKEDWEFCPYCGEKIETEELEEKEMITPFRSIFSDIDKEFERIDKMFGFDSFNFPSFKMKPGIRGGGVSITIQSGTGMKPKVEIKTSGEYKKLEPELKRKFGIKPAIEEVEEEKMERKKHKVKLPKVTEEPESEIQTIGNKQIISIKLPDVKSEDDIEIKRLEQSIEVKAFTDDKAYFKLIPIPKDGSISKKFKDGILKIEIEK